MGEATTTKPPIRRRRIIERPRLTRLLDESQGRIKLLVAPAGYGKTTLARQWVGLRAATWYEVSPSSTDVAALAAGIAKAAGAQVAGAGATMLERLRSTAASEQEPEVLAGMLAVDLAQWPPDAWLVLDDYQAIEGSSAAERFVASLLLSAPLNVLLMSRRRPWWASARQILYGEIFVLDRASLAMTEAEAFDLLDRRGPEAVGMVELAQGWPAVLALAHISGASVPEVVAIPHLHDFFAGEIYNRLDITVRRSLCELALYNVESRAAGIRHLPYQNAEVVTSSAIESGFLVEVGNGTFDMHPLLTAFLEEKLGKERKSDTSAVIARVARVLMSLGSWDEAFHVIVRYQHHELLPQLLESSMSHLLDSGRTSTLRRWLEACPEETPAVELAAAELAFREGRFHTSEALATMCARSSDNTELAAQALLVAGRAAHAASREEMAAEHYKRAGEITASASAKRVAMLGALGAAIEMENPDAITLMDALEPTGALDPSERVIVVSRKINLETRFALPISLEEARAMWQLLSRVADPMTRTSFRNVFGYVLAAMGFGDEATLIIDELLDDADHYRLDFVIPYALTTKALIAVGVRAYGSAAELLDEAEERALGAGDQTAYHIAWCVRTRLNNAQAAFDVSLSRAIPRDCAHTRSLEAELLASYAVALAGRGEFVRARDYAHRAGDLSIAVETAVSAPCALAVAAIRSGDHSGGLTYARQALAVTTRSGMIEAFVSAYRGCPDLIVCLLQDTDTHDELSRVLTTAGDATAMRSSDHSLSILQLSTREKEVLALLSQGFTNPQIGKRLFITAGTVKVHVRHIFDKLGVSSRAEAAMRAAQLRSD